MHPIASSPLLPTSEPPSARHRPPSRCDHLSPDAAALVNELWDCAHPHVDLRRFAPETFEEIAPFWLSHCKDARFVALPAHCPVSAIHTLMLGLPALEGLFLWSPGGTEPINPALGIHLTTVIADLATLSRVTSPGGVKLVACGAWDLPVEALTWQDACNTQPRPPRRPWPPARPQRPDNRGERIWTMYEASQPGCTRNDAVGYRLANWTASGAGSSRPSSPEVPLPQWGVGALAPETARGSAAAPAKRFRRATLDRLQASCESLFRRLPSIRLRRSRSV